MIDLKKKPIPDPRRELVTVLAKIAEKPSRTEQTAFTRRIIALSGFAKASEDQTPTRCRAVLLTLTIGSNFEPNNKKCKGELI